MKVTFFILTISASLLAGILFTGCQKSSKEEKANEARMQELAMAQQQAQQESEIEAYQIASADDWVEFNSESEEKIKEYEIQISDLKLQVKKSGKIPDVKQINRIGQFKQKITELKTRMQNFDKNQSGFEKFRRAFNLDLDELGKAIKNLKTEIENKSLVSIQKD